MKKFIAIPAIAAIAIVGLAACDTDTTASEPTTQSAPKSKPPVNTSPVDGLSSEQWNLIEEYGTDAGLSSNETEDIAEDVVASFSYDIAGTCNDYYVLGDSTTQDVLIDAAFDTYGPDAGVVAASAAYAVIVNNC